MSHGLCLNLIWKWDLRNVPFDLALFRNMVMLCTFYLVPKFEKRSGSGLNEFTS